jgi:hypothetical protein
MPENPDVITPRLIALGMITENSAALDSTLRGMFCALVGSKYAALLAAGQPTGWLIGYCKTLAKKNLEIQKDHRDAILAALTACEQANERRNRLVHDIKTGSRKNDGRLQTLQSSRHEIEPKIQRWTPATINDAAVALAQADGQLFGALLAAFSPEAAVLDEALGWELQHRTAVDQDPQA